MATRFCFSHHRTLLVCAAFPAALLLILGSSRYMGSNHDSRWLQAVDQVAQSNGDDVVIDVSDPPQLLSADVNGTSARRKDWSGVGLERVNPESFPVAGLTTRLDWKQEAPIVVEALARSVRKDPVVDPKSLAAQLQNGKPAATPDAQRGVAIIARQGLLRTVQRRVSSLDGELNQARVQILPPKGRDGRRGAMIIQLRWGNVNWPYWEESQQGRRYSSDKSSRIALQAVSLRDALEAVAERSHVTMVIGEIPHNRRVTIRSRNASPREVLTTIVRLFDLGAVERSDGLHVELQKDTWPERLHRMRLQAHRAGEAASLEFYRMLPAPLQAKVRKQGGMPVADLPGPCKQKLREAVHAKFSAENLFQCALAEDPGLGKGVINFPQGRSTATMIYRGVRISLRELGPALGAPKPPH